MKNKANERVTEIMKRRNGITCSQDDSSTGKVLEVNPT